MTVRNERTLLVLRHAKSGWSGGEADIDRTLNSRGHSQATDVGSWLAEQFSIIDVAIVSPATRARATWALVAAELKSSPEARVDERAYAASVSDLLQIVQELPDELRTVILVAHNPGLEELVSVLTGESVTLPTSALAVLGVPGTWAELAASTAVLVTSGRASRAGLA
ncbi:histidine phosphatase family protein [Cryobacterium adonitolivorans]|uniref:Histidine phosphatase family protein n=1 Tax=Cryobacterium adonitolivorans TaxID=1259189 RepID=A0A4R8WCH6_9MICO|nr:histidine phosphatase family protein [Cryobacterium adonitolivorans]TFC06983.1 histidine phosphatase family protein [Cryobacterium adonitolivorans]